MCLSSCFLLEQESLDLLAKLGLIHFANGLPNIECFFGILICMELTKIRENEIFHLPRGSSIVSNDVGLITMKYTFDMEGAASNWPV